MVSKDEWCIRFFLSISSPLADSAFFFPSQPSTLEKTQLSTAPVAPPTAEKEHESGPDYSWTSSSRRSLALELVRVTEAAALSGARWLGKGDKNAAGKERERECLSCRVSGFLTSFCSFFSLSHEPLLLLALKTKKQTKPPSTSCAGCSTRSRWTASSSSAKVK